MTMLTMSEQTFINELTNFINPTKKIITIDNTYDFGSKSSLSYSMPTIKHIAHIKTIIDIKNKLSIDDNYMTIYTELIKGFFENLDNDLERSYNLIVPEKLKRDVHPQLEIILLEIMLFPNVVKLLHYNIDNFLAITSIIDKGILNIITKYHMHLDMDYSFGYKNTCKFKFVPFMIDCNMVYSSEYCLKNLNVASNLEIRKSLSGKIAVITSHKCLYKFDESQLSILEELLKFCRFATTTCNKYQKYKELELLHKENQELKAKLKTILDPEDVKTNIKTDVKTVVEDDVKEFDIVESVSSDLLSL
jgi:hypothetical protein